MKDVEILTVSMCSYIRQYVFYQCVLLETICGFYAKRNLCYFAFVFSCRLPTVNIEIDHRLPYNLQTVLVFLAHHNVMTYFSVQQ